MNIKQKVYELLSTEMEITDNPYVKKNIPSGLLSLITLKENDFKNCSQKYWLLRLDLFSEYKGEKEIIETYESVKRLLQQLRIDKVVDTVNFSLTIMDDDETGPFQKHGIVSIYVQEEVM